MRPRRAFVAALALSVALALGGPAAAEAPASEASGASEAREGFGLGLILGEPIGLSAKFWLDRGSALQFHLAWDFSDAGIGIYGDYLFHFDVFDVSDFDLPLYVGGGLSYVTRNPGSRSTSNNEPSSAFGLRLPLGITLLMHSLPLEFFGEIVPGLRLVPTTRFNLDGAVGARYYF